MASRELPPGLYDDLVTVAFERLVSALDSSSQAQFAELSDGDAPQRLSRHMADAIEMVLDAFDDDGRTAAGTALVHDLLAVLADHAPDAIPRPPSRAADAHVDGGRTAPARRLLSQDRAAAHVVARHDAARERAGGADDPA